MSQRNTRINRRQISSVDADDLYAINSPLDGYVPSYDLSTGKFSWVLLPTTALEIDTDESGVSVQDALDGRVKLDQTIEQEIINGIPKLEESRTIDEIHHLVDKLYVDTAVTSLGSRFYMLSTLSGVTQPVTAEEYYLTSMSASAELESSVTATNPADDEYIAGWISPVGQAPTKLIAGVYTWDIFAAKTGGNKAFRLYWTLVERKSNDDEVVIATSAESNLLGAKALLEVPLTLSEDYTPDVGSRIIGKVYAVLVSGASATDIVLYSEGNSDSHWEIPTNIEVLQDTFEQVSNKKTDLTDDSDTYYPSQKAVKTAVDAKVDKVADHSLVADTEITKIHEHSNKTELDKVTVGDHDVASGNPHGTVADDIDTDESGITVQDKLSQLDIEKEDKYTVINTQTDNYTLVLSDVSKLIDMEKSVDYIQLTIPNNSNVAFPIGTNIRVRQKGLGKVAIGGAGDVTINTPDGLSTTKQYDIITLIKIAENTWTMYGSLTSVFMLEVTTLSDNKTFTLPLVSGSSYNIDVDWGDGTTDNITTWNQAEATHVYDDFSTVYNVIITGSCPKFQFNDAGSKLLVTKLLDVANLDFTHLDFYGCTNLTTISSKLSLLDLDTCENMFRASGVTSIPAGIFDGCTRVAASAFRGTFYGCSGLTSIPTDLFRYNTAVSTYGFYRTFAGCSKLTSIPTDLFRYNTAVSTYGFGETFYSCSGLTSIPTDLFRYNTAVSTEGFAYTFYSCSGLTSIPTDLFRYNTAVSTSGFYLTFYSCSGLTSVPELLFKYNTDCTSFYRTFLNCNKLQLNAKLFYDTGEQSTRFLNKTVSFQQCFYRTSFTGTQGTAPDLWNCDFGSGTPTKTGCFAGAGNSLTSLTNYADIPQSWGGPLEE